MNIETISSQTIGIVTDSTAYLPESFVKQFGIEVVPVQVVVDGKSLSEITEISIADLVKDLRANKSVTTSRPTVQNFVQVYEKLRASGVSEILSIHLSSELSGTYESAMLAAQRVDFPVKVIDSKGVAGFLELAVQHAVELRANGKNLEEISTALITYCAETKIYFYVDTLEFLQRGGRISMIRSKLGQLMTFKPLLTMREGRVELLELVRSEAKALNRLLELACNEGPNHEFRINHVAAPERAINLAEAIENQLKISTVAIRETGAVVGAHVGPGAVAVTIH